MLHTDRGLDSFAENNDCTYDRYQAK